MRKLVVLAVIAGCYTDAKPVAAPSAAQPAASNPYARTLGDPLGFLPRDAEIILHVDGTALRRTPLWARIEPAIMTKATETLEPLRQQCGLDLIRQIERITVGVRQVPDSEGVLVIVGLDRTQVMGCMMRVAKSAPQTLRIERNVVVMAPDPADKPVAFTFVDATTLVVVVGAEAKSADGVRALLAAGSPLRANERVTEMHRRIVEPHHAWMIADGKGKVLATFGALGGTPVALLATVDAPAGATAQVVFHMNADADATAVTTTLRGQVQAISAMVDKIDIAQDGADVIIDVGLSEMQLATTLGLLGL